MEMDIKFYEKILTIIIDQAFIFRLKLHGKELKIIFLNIKNNYVKRLKVDC